MNTRKWIVTDTTLCIETRHSAILERMQQEDQASVKVLVTESTKFSLRALVRYALPSEIHALVTDKNLSEADYMKLKYQDVNVIIARETNG